VNAVADCRGAPYRARRSVERGEEAVAGGIDSCPRKRPSSARTALSWAERSSRQLLSPSSAALSVEATMSVKRTVASTRSGTDSRRRPLMNRSTSSGIVSSACKPRSTAVSLTSSTSGPQHHRCPFDSSGPHGVLSSRACEGAPIHSGKGRAGLGSGRAPDRRLRLPERGAFFALRLPVRRRRSSRRWRYCRQPVGRDVIAIGVDRRELAPQTGWPSSAACCYESVRLVRLLKTVRSASASSGTSPQASSHPQSRGVQPRWRTGRLGVPRCRAAPLWWSCFPVSGGAADNGA
jgi:hypothetical protein